MPSTRNRKQSSSSSASSNSKGGKEVGSSYSDFDSDVNVKDGDETDLDSIMDKRELEELKKNETPGGQDVIKQPVTWQKMIIRSVTASFMAILYLCILYAGHFYCILAVAILQVCILHYFFKYLHDLQY